MRLIYRLVISAIVAMAAMLPINAYAQTDAQNAGIKIGYVGKNHSTMVGAFYQLPVNEYMRLSPEVGYIFRNRNLSAFNADINVHFPLNIYNGKSNIYPLAGLDFTTWRLHDINHAQYGNVSKTYSRFGLNLGAGFEYFTTRNIKLKVEWKYTLTSKYSTMVLDAGVGYFF